ncbi:MAG TPA: citrate synthase family protein [Vicinamibacterales bacterium]|nr:citrate synthase family protein [Vicinamibacterales bacterium]
MNVPVRNAWLPAADAAHLLGVTRPTLYAYVSRGFVRSQAVPGSTRERVYAREDLDRLRQKANRARTTDPVDARVLQWGLPVLESAITLIDGQHLYYRGHDAVSLAGSCSVEEVAALIWTGRLDRVGALHAGRPPRTRRRGREIPRFRNLPYIARAQALLAIEAARDPAAFDLRPDSVAATGWRIVRLVTSAATWTDGGGTVDEALARAWGLDGGAVPVLRAILILCADHELNVSSFTARSVASAGSHLYGVVVAGLAALEGPRHGGASARVEAVLASLRRARRLGPSIAEKLRRGEPLDGFGHPLYRDGDPRARALLGMLEACYGRMAECRYVIEFARTAASATGEQPNLDFALAAAARVLRLPAGSPLVLFAIGRSIGWIGHAIEQYAAGHLIRPRARYVGVVPMPAAGGATP